MNSLIKNNKYLCCALKLHCYTRPYYHNFSYPLYPQFRGLHTYPIRLTAATLGSMLFFFSVSRWSRGGFVVFLSLLLSLDHNTPIAVAYNVFIYSSHAATYASIYCLSVCTLTAHAYIDLFFRYGISWLGCCLFVSLGAGVRKMHAHDL